MNPNFTITEETTVASPSSAHDDDRHFTADEFMDETVHSRFDEDDLYLHEFGAPDAKAKNRMMQRFTTPRRSYSAEGSGSGSGGGLGRLLGRNSGGRGGATTTTNNDHNDSDHHRGGNASVTSQSSSVSFSETKLGKLLSQRGFTADHDFNVQAISPRSSLASSNNGNGGSGRRRKSSMNPTNGTSPRKKNGPPGSGRRSSTTTPRKSNSGNTSTPLSKFSVPSPFGGSSNNSTHSSRGLESGAAWPQPDESPPQENLMRNATTEEEETDYRISTDEDEEEYGGDGRRRTTTTGSSPSSSTRRLFVKDGNNNSVFAAKPQRRTGDPTLDLTETSSSSKEYHDDDDDDYYVDDGHSFHHRNPETDLDVALTKDGAAVVVVSRRARLWAMACCLVTCLALALILVPIVLARHMQNNKASSRSSSSGLRNNNNMNQPTASPPQHHPTLAPVVVVSQEPPSSLEPNDELSWETFGTSSTTTTKEPMINAESSTVASTSMDVATAASTTAATTASSTTTTTVATTSSTTTTTIPWDADTSEVLTNIEEDWGAAFGDAPFVTTYHVHANQVSKTLKVRVRLPTIQTAASLDVYASHHGFLSPTELCSQSTTTSWRMNNQQGTAVLGPGDIVEFHMPHYRDITLTMCVDDVPVAATAHFFLQHRGSGKLPTFESDFVDLRADTSHVKKINFTERATDQANKVHRAVVVLTPPQNNEGDDYAYDDDDDYVDEGTYDNGEDIADEDSLWWIDPVDYDRWTQADRYGASCPDKWTHVTTYSVDFHGGGKGNRRFPGVKIWVLWDHDIATHTPDDGVFETQIVRCAPTVVARGDITVSKAELL